MNDKDRRTAEMIFADRMAAKLPSEALDRWYSCHSGHRFQAFFGKQLVVYRLMCGVPNILDTLVCKELQSSLHGGMVSLWWSEETKKDIWVGHEPVEVAHNCFMWHGQYSTADFLEHNNRFNMKFSLAYRTLSNPNSLKEGDICILEKKTFDGFEF